MKQTRKGEGEKIWAVAVLIVAVSIALTAYLAGEGMVTDVAESASIMSLVADLTAGAI